jgi:hypothetical protein
MNAIIDMPPNVQRGLTEFSVPRRTVPPRCTVAACVWHVRFSTEMESAEKPDRRSQDKGRTLRGFGRSIGASNIKALAQGALAGHTVPERASAGDHTARRTLLAISP